VASLIAPPDKEPRMPAPFPSNTPLALAGWTISAAVGIFLLFSAGTKFLKTPAVLAEFQHLGYPESAILPIAVAQTLGIALYLIPRTGVLGATLVTAYMGGGAAVHLRAGDAVLLPIATAILAWTGLVLRDHRVRSVMPWKTNLTHTAPQGAQSHRSLEP
jgi:hypothetical protein